MEDLKKEAWKQVKSVFCLEPKEAKRLLLVDEKDFNKIFDIIMKVMEKKDES